MRIVAILNHKGGVGKTTFTGCVGQALALSGFRVCAIDNDSQHNLSTLLGVGVVSPGIRDVYRAPDGDAPRIFMQSVRKSDVQNLHVVTADGDLCESDVGDIWHLRRTIAACRLERFYDVLLIDNPPGLDRLQGSAVRAADEIFVPTELKQFAIDGLVEMEKIVTRRYPDSAPITRIIPNFFRNTVRQRSYVAALRSMFPGRVTDTAIPVDSVFDEVVTDGKILFLHRLYSNGAAYYLKIIHELFDLDEEKLWDQVMEKRAERIRAEARKRYFEYRSRKSDTNEA